MSNDSSPRKTSFATLTMYKSVLSSKRVKNSSPMIAAKRKAEIIVQDIEDRQYKIKEKENKLKPIDNSQMR